MPPVITTGGPLTICEGDSVLLVSNLSANMVWNTGQTGDSIYAATAGEYVVTVTDSLGCPAASTPVVVRYPDRGMITATGTVVCEGDPVTLTAGDAETYRWSTGDTTRAIGIAPSRSAYYSVQMTDVRGCTYADSLFITTLAYPKIVALSADTSLCAGESVTLEVFGSAIAYRWSTGTTGTSVRVTPEVTTTYQVIASNGAVCSVTDTAAVTVFVNPLPADPAILYAGGPVFCAGNSVLLTTDVTGSLQWSTGQTGDSIYVTEGGTYAVTYTDDSLCSSTSLPLELTTAPVPAIAQGESLTICLGDTVTLSVTDGTSWAWSTGDSVAAIIVVPAVTTTYRVQADNVLGCAYTDSITVNVSSPAVPGPVSNMIPADGTDDMTLPMVFSWRPVFEATGYDLYLWPDTAPRPETPIVRNTAQISYWYGGSLSDGVTYSWQVVAVNACHATPGPVQHFTLRHRPDLIVENVQTPASAFSGQSVGISWEVTNIGQGSTRSQNWTDAIYLSTDTTFEIDVDTYLGGTTNFAALLPAEGYAHATTVTLPRGISGYHYIFVQADAFGNLAETDNGNNVARIADTLLINLEPFADLQVTHILPPNNVFSGQEVDIVYTVENRGTGAPDAGAWTDQIYITDDPGGVGGKRLASRRQARGLDVVGDRYTDTVRVQIPEATFGSHYFYAVTDADNDVFEFVFDNNNTLVSDSVNVFLTPPPDLQVTDIVIPERASNHEDITVRWEVTNEGGSAITASSWQDRVYLSASPDFSAPIYLGEVTRSEVLEPDSAYRAQKNVRIPNTIGGLYYVFVEIDAGHRIFEYVYEANNRSRSDTTLLIPNADVTARNVTAPDSVRSGESMRVMWTTVNQGPGEVIGKTWQTHVGLLPAGTPYHPDAVIGLGSSRRSGTLLSGDTLANGVVVTLPRALSGNYELILQIDAGNAIYEGTNEANNIITGPAVHVELSPFPDLQVISAQTMDTATVWDRVPVDFTVGNEGEAEVRGVSWRDYVYASLDSVWNPRRAWRVGEFSRSQELAVGETYSVNNSVRLPLLPSVTDTATYYLFFYADARNTVYEHASESNNIGRSNPIHVYSPPDSVHDYPPSDSVFYYPPPDFTVTDLVTADSVSSGERVTVSWRTENRGNAPDGTEVTWWYDGAYLSRDTVWDGSDTFLQEWRFYRGNMATGAYASGARSYRLPEGIEGDYHILLVTDRTNRVKEADETNNTLWRTVHVTLTPPPDLVVTRLEAPALGTAGQPVTISWTVENVGVGPTLQGSRSGKVYLSTDFNIDGRDRIVGSYSRSGDLAPGQAVDDSLEITLPMVASGNYILILRTDDNNRIYEHLGEGNNTRATLMEIVLPEPSDLIVTGVSAPGNAFTGDMVDVSWTVENTGQYPANGFMKEVVYFSRDTLWSIDDVVLATLESRINLAPLGTLAHSLSSRLRGVSAGAYHAIVRTDILDNIYEGDDSNNSSAAVSPTYVGIPELPLDVWVADTLLNFRELYYRIEVPDSLAGESLLVLMQGDSLEGANEFYLRYGEVPTRSVHDYAHANPYLGHQELIVPELQAGTYYLMAYGNTFGGDRQPSDWYARILDFEIRSVDARSGGNTGQVTVKVNGSKFDNTMKVCLANPTDTLCAVRVVLTDPVTVYATFDLAGADTGIYDVIGERDGEDDLAVLEGGFTIREGVPTDLQIDVLHPSDSRVGRSFVMTVRYSNAGNTDIVDPAIEFSSIAGAPIAFAVEGLDDENQILTLLLEEPGGVPGVLRPGVGSTIVIYSKASSGLAYTLVLPDLD